LAACRDLADKEKERQFFEDCKMHFNHIRRVVTETFHTSGYELDKTDAVLEPSYICEALGLQGRLDYMQRDMLSFIEMKSGKADEYSIRGKVEPKENNKVQMLLYQAVLQYSMGMDHRKVRPYLLYTRYPLLYPARSSWAMVKRSIDLRNRIVANEFGVQLHNNAEFTANMLAQINPETLNEKKLKGRFWEQYLFPTIAQFKEKLNSLTDLERSYYNVLYNFITKEQYTAKSGDVDYEGRTGAASLWLSSLAEKREAGEILYDLKIKDNRATDEHKASLTLSIPNEALTAQIEELGETLPNFRQGDAVALYERNSDTDNVTNKMVFKGNIESITDSEIKLRLRATQQNPSVLPPGSLYAIEHDAMDTVFRGMYLGLAIFASANKDRRDLILSQRQPDFDDSYDEAIANASDDFSRVVLKAQAAKDYFLLVGPPGTGKTSRALRLMVEAFHQTPDAQILLLAYTNRAVDEICKALSSITPEIDFIRIGSELACEPTYRKHLIENELALCNRRSEVVHRMKDCRTFVGTVASVANKPELFQLKSFDVAIVDEATQILEPQLLGILCARRENHANAIGKFILIGDHKQLPAVVQQNSAQSQIYDKALLGIGLTNLKDSLFERLYRTVRGQIGFDCSANSNAFDQLCRQGRMNPAIALFPNEAFYGGLLKPVGLPHQVDELKASANLVPDMLSLLMTQRMAYLPSLPQKEGSSAKVNHSEALICAQLTMKVFEQYGSSFDPDYTLGIITPYRSQIALIKKQICQLDIPVLRNILVDTVERFQGSERDVIIYSCCVNHAYQLHFVSNIIDEDDIMIDRKLNVALTRARKQMFVTGVQDVLCQHPIYNKLLNFITTKVDLTNICTY